uniref:Protein DETOXIFICATION n=1 Tax=Cajanus cajan TaxID=3821 RepID=A0A151TGX0_CAJCA|nr:Protein TRANSPARENT TESTA 12 [Cajanus cajan]
MSSDKALASDEANHPLLEDHINGQEREHLVRRVWIESKKLWIICGPAIFNRVANFSMFVITQAFAGHLGDLELAATSIAINVILGLDFGILLGMSSALDTLCGQAFGAKKYSMLGIYLQRSWLVLFITGVVILPLFLFVTPILKFIGQSPEIAELTGVISLWLIPTHLAYIIYLPLHFFLQSQLKNNVIALVSLLGLLLHAFLCWLVVTKFHVGVIALVAFGNFAWLVLVLGYFGYVIYGGCTLTWTGFSMEAFSGLWEFAKLSTSSGIMTCLEVWYDKALMLMTGNLQNAKTSIEALTICLTINIWELMFPLSFFAATGVRVANELGAGNGKGAKFAAIVSVVTSIILSIFFWLLIMIFRDQLAYIFSSSEVVIKEVNKLSPFLGVTILLNSVQPVLSGVAVGSGWQQYVAFINLGSYYLIGLPLGYLLGFVFDLGVQGVWAGLIFGGPAIQTLILAWITARCDWDREVHKNKFYSFVNIFASAYY